MSVEDPRLVVWAREQAQALGQISTEKRVRIIERTIGVPAKQVRDDLQGQLDTVSSEVDAKPTVLGSPGSVMTFGLDYITWGGGFATATVAGIAHGLGKTPTAVILSPQSQAGTGPITLQLASPPGATSFTAYACTVPVGSDPGYVPPAGTSVPFGWIAIG